MNLKKTLQALTFIVCLLSSFNAVAQEAYAVYSYMDLTLTFYYDDQRSSHSETTFDLNSGANAPGWFDSGAYEDVTQVVFDPSFADARPTTTYAWFIHMSSLHTITGLEYLNTIDVTNMSYMFYGCERIKEIDVRTFNTANVTTMYGLFYGCRNLSGLDLENFNTANVTNMGGMFRGCSSLRGLDLSTFDTGKVTKMSYMFYQCESLMTIFTGEGWNTESVTVSDGMFGGCTSLAGNMGTSYDAGHTDMEYAHIDGGSVNPGYLSSPNDEFPENYVCYTATNSTLTFYHDNRSIFRPGIFFELNTGTEIPAWTNDEYNSYYAEHIVFDPSFAGARPTTTYKWFYEMCYIQSFTGLDYLNTSDVTNMSKMFYRNWRMNSLDVSHFNTEKVTDMSCMFYDLENLTGLDVSNFNTSNVTDMNHMFYYCHRVNSLDLSGFNTANVTDMSYMLASCERVESFDLNNFDTEKVTNMRGMFDGCRYTKSFDLSSFNTANVTDMSLMFNDCFRLKALDVSSFNTSNVTNMSEMFRDCYRVNCLDLSSFTTPNVREKALMFCGCDSLTTIYVSHNWDFSNDINCGDMFWGCISIVGGMGTTYDPNHVGREYAHIDGGPSYPGYFTARPAFARGDVNCDGNVNITDATALIDILLSGSTAPDSADMNNDGIVNISDATALINYLLSSR